MNVGNGLLLPGCLGRGRSCTDGPAGTVGIGGGICRGYILNRLDTPTLFRLVRRPRGLHVPGLRSASICGPEYQHDYVLHSMVPI